MLSCVGNAPPPTGTRGSATKPGREGGSWEALPERQHDQSLPPGCPGARHSSSAAGVAPALPGWAGLCCPHSPQCPGSTSCTHRTRESRHPELLSALIRTTAAAATLTLSHRGSCILTLTALPGAGTHWKWVWGASLLQHHSGIKHLCLAQPSGNPCSHYRQ